MSVAALVTCCQGDQLVLRVDRHLRVVADNGLLTRDHRARIGVAQRDLALTAGGQLVQHRLLRLPPLAHPGDLCRQCLAAPRPMAILAAVDGIQLGQVSIDPLVGRGDVPGQLVAGEVASRIVDRLQPGAVHCQQLASEQVELAAQDDEGAEHGFERAPVVATEVGDGLVVRPQPAQQPDQLEVPRRLRFQSPARPHPAEIAVKVQLEHVPRIVAGPPRRLWLRTLKAGLAQIKVIDERVDEPNRIVRRHIILDRCRQQQRLLARMTLDICHEHRIHLSATQRNQPKSFRTVWAGCWR
jgi:hypothetical protein